MTFWFLKFITKFGMFLVDSAACLAHVKLKTRKTGITRHVYLGQCSFLLMFTQVPVCVRLVNII